MKGEHGKSKKESKAGSPGAINTNVKQHSREVAAFPQATVNVTHYLRADAHHLEEGREKKVGE